MSLPTSSFHPGCTQKSPGELKNYISAWNPFLDFLVNRHGIRHRHPSLKKKVSSASNMKPELRTVIYLGIALCTDEESEGQRFPVSDLSLYQVVFPLPSHILVLFQGSILVLDLMIKPLPPCPLHTLYGEMKLGKAEVDEGN